MVVLRVGLKVGWRVGLKVGWRVGEKVEVLVAQLAVEMAC
jgi:hypothetical protein